MPKAGRRSNWRKRRTWTAATLQESKSARAIHLSGRWNDWRGPCRSDRLDSLTAEEMPGSFAGPAVAGRHRRPRP